MVTEIQGFRSKIIMIKYSKMADIFEIFGELSYFGIFLVLIGVNASPILMPPSWIILTSFYLLDPNLNIVLLSIVGATGATIGRFFLKKISGLFRKFVGEEQKSNLDIIGDYLNRKKFGYLIASFLFGATPLPSNILFITYGLMRAKSVGIYIGFWFGRVLSYIIMIYFGNAVLKPFIEIFEDRLTGILLVDLAGIVVIIFFASINWSLLITKRKLKFVKPKLWRF
jgi:membrane protein DedA with SNARE-associated domain